MKTAMRLQGGPEMAARLRRLSDAAAGKALEDAVTAGALIVQNAAKRKAPWITGNLRRSIHVGGHVGESGSLVDTTGSDIGGNKNSRTQATVLVGTNVDYAKVIEYGTGKRPAKPYLRPALDEKKDAAAREIGNALRDLLRHV